jgi:hypothetical protein
MNKYRIEDKFDVAFINKSTGEKVAETKMVSFNNVDQKREPYYLPVMDLVLTDDELEKALEFEGKDMEMDINGVRHIGYIKRNEDKDKEVNATFYKKFE